jgi:two-component system response regulator FixJ
VAEVAEAEERRRAAERIERLTDEERMVLAGVAAGKPNRMLVEELGLSALTVEVCRATLMTKLEARSLSDLIRLALLAEGPND